MSDASDFTSALQDLKRLAQPDAAPLLTYGNGSAIDTTKDLDAILQDNKLASTFAALTPYVIGDVVMPTTRDGHRYIVTEAGTSATEPTWSDGQGAETVSGTVTFTEAGPDYSNIYNVRTAAYDAWNLKAGKVSQLSSDVVSQVFEHIVMMRDSFRTAMIA